MSVRFKQFGDTGGGGESGGRPAGDSSSRARRGRLWLLLPAGLFALNVTIVAVTVTLAAGDRSVATEPDYYRKAMKFDDQAQLREASRKLGWTVSVSARPKSPGRSTELAVTLKDRDGRSVEGARVEAVAFAHVRSGERQTVHMLAVEGAPGEYAGPVAIDRSGLWHVGLAVERGGGGGGSGGGGDRFVHETELLIPD